MNLVVQRLIIYDWTLDAYDLLVLVSVVFNI